MFQTTKSAQINACLRRHSTKKLRKLSCAATTIAPAWREKSCSSQSKLTENWSKRGRWLTLRPHHARPGLITPSASLRVCASAISMVLDHTCTVQYCVSSKLRFIYCPFLFSHHWDYSSSMSIGPSQISNNSSFLFSCFCSLLH